MQKGEVKYNRYFKLKFSCEKYKNHYLYKSKKIKK